MVKKHEAKVVQKKIQRIQIKKGWETYFDEDGRMIVRNKVVEKELTTLHTNPKKMAEDLINKAKAYIADQENKAIDMVIYEQFLFGLLVAAAKAQAGRFEFMISREVKHRHKLFFAHASRFVESIHKDYVKEGVSLTAITDVEEYIGEVWGIVRSCMMKGKNEDLLTMLKVFHGSIQNPDKAKGDPKAKV